MYAITTVPEHHCNGEQQRFMIDFKLLRAMLGKKKKKKAERTWIGSHAKKLPFLKDAEIYDTYVDL